VVTSAAGTTRACRGGPTTSAVRGGTDMPFKRADSARCATVRIGGWHARPGFGRTWAMRFSSLFVVSPAVAILSIELFCGLSGPAMSQTSPGSAASLPSVTVEAPKQVARPKRSAVTHTVSRHTSPVTQAASAAPDSDSAKLARLARITGSCVDGCQTSFRSGNHPWNGCSGSGWPALSLTCRNVGNFKSYIECRESGLLVGWRPPEVTWYCSSLAVKYAWAK
jgi:hypothetical protein